MSCAHCVDADRHFSSRIARFDQAWSRRFGLKKTTRMLIDAVRERAGSDISLLDIGGGTGSVVHGLADRMASATAVDAAAAYLSAARERAEREGYADRMTWLEGDFTDLADRVPVHDVVTLDRVICCYPDMPRLVAASGGRAGRICALVFPREVAYNRISFRLMNAWLRLRRSDFRVFVHDTAGVDRAAADQGLRLADTRSTRLWQLRMYVRETGPNAV